MYRTNLTLSVTVLEITSETRIPDHCLPLTDGVTHLVDLIEIKRGDAEVGLIVSLEGRFNEKMRIFTFSDNVRDRIRPIFRDAFGVYAEPMIGIVQEAVNYNIISENLLANVVR